MLSKLKKGGMKVSLEDEGYVYHLVDKPGKEITPMVLRDVTRLLSQASGSFTVPNRDALVAAAAHSRLLLVFNRHGRVDGMGTLTFSHRPSGTVARIEDLVVEEELRRLGMGTKIVRELEKEKDLQHPHSGPSEIIGLPESHPEAEGVFAFCQKVGYPLKSKPHVYRQMTAAPYGAIP